MLQPPILLMERQRVACGFRFACISRSAPSIPLALARVAVFGSTSAAGFKTRVDIDWKSPHGSRKVGSYFTLPHCAAATSTTSRSSLSIFETGDANKRKSVCHKPSVKRWLNRSTAVGTYCLADGCHTVTVGVIAVPSVLVVEILYLLYTGFATQAEV